MKRHHIPPVGKSFHNSRLHFQSWLPVTLVLVLAMGLYFYRINGEGLWLDELTSIRDAQELPMKY